MPAHRLAVLAALSMLTLATTARGADPPALTEDATEAPPAKRGAADKVYLDGGAVISGTVIEQKPGKHVIVRTPDGEENRIEWGVITKVVLAKNGAAAAGPAPRTPAKPKKACDEDDESCQQSVSATGAASGVGVGVKGERVVHLKAPGKSATMMAIDGGFLYGTSTKSSAKFNIYGGGVNLNVTFRGGGTFPGEEGGVWHGVGVDIYGGVFGAGVVAGNTGAGSVLVNVGGSLGYQLYSFGTMNEETFKQHGFGLFLAGRVGVSNSHVFATGGSSSSTDAQYGPQLTISFPSYNFGTTSRSAFYVSGFVLPTGDFLFANIQLGGAFSL